MVCKIVSKESRTFVEAKVTSLKVLQARVFTSAERWSAVRRKPVTCLDMLTKKMNIELKSYGWTVIEQDTEDAAVMGYIKVPQGREKEATDSADARLVSSLKSSVMG